VTSPVENIFVVILIYTVFDTCYGRGGTGEEEVGEEEGEDRSSDGKKALNNIRRIRSV